MEDVLTTPRRHRKVLQYSLVINEVRPTRQRYRFLRMVYEESKAVPYQSKTAHGRYAVAEGS